MRAGTFDIVFQAEAAGLNAMGSVRTEVVDTSLEVRFAPEEGFHRLRSGTRFATRSTSPIGRQTLTGLRLLVEAEPGIVEASKGVSEWNRTWTVSARRRSLGIPFQIRQEGQHNVRLSVMSPGQSCLPSGLQPF